jgi:cytochrome c553
MKKILVSVATLVLSALSFNAAAGGNVQAGKALVEKFACASCHSADFNSPVMEGVPKLAGQHEDYLTHAMFGYLRGGKGANGRESSTMGPQIRRVVDGKEVPLTSREIKDISAYLSSLKGSLVTRK